MLFKLYLTIDVDVSKFEEDEQYEKAEEIIQNWLDNVPKEIDFVDIEQK